MYQLKPGMILLAEKTRGFELSNFFPFIIRLVIGNKIIHTGVVESCYLNSIVYWDSGPEGVGRRTIPNIKNDQEGGLILANDTVVTWVSELPLDLATSDQVTLMLEEIAKVNRAKYNYSGILNTAWDHFMRLFQTLPKTQPDCQFGYKFTCSQLISYAMSKAGIPFSQTFAATVHPALVEPDNFKQSPFIVTPIADLAILQSGLSDQPLQ